MIQTVKEWVRQMFHFKSGTPPHQQQHQAERDAVKREIAQGLHDAAARLHVLEYQVDVEGRRRQARSHEQESG